ncbi:MAG: hypothetical protein WCG01_04985 [bacterium]
MKKILATSGLAIALFLISTAPSNAAQCVITLFGQQYDVTALQTSHSGGNVFVCGTDQTAIYQAKHGTNMSRMTPYLVASSSTTSATTTPGTTATTTATSTKRWSHETENNEKYARESNRRENEKKQLEKRREISKQKAELQKKQSEKKLQLKGNFNQRKKATNTQKDISKLEQKIKNLNNELAKLLAQK